jgi:hypothetical protein
MANLVPEISSAIVVLLGSFNPKIFQPEWFARHELLPQGEADAAEIKLIIPQVCHFETERFIVQVTEQQFIAGTKPNANSAPLRDLVQGAFFILEHTPVGAMGINHLMHFATGSEQNWHRIGDRLAPKDGWNEVLEGRPGLSSMTILTNKDAPPGAQFRIKVEPSIAVPLGVYFETNEHYPGPEKDSLKGLMGVLNDRWEESQVYATKVVEHIFTWANKTR